MSFCGFDLVLVNSRKDPCDEVAKPDIHVCKMFWGSQWPERDANTLLVSSNESYPF